MLLLVAEFLDLLGQLPVHEVAFALGNLCFVLGDVAQNLCFGRAVRWKHLFDGAGCKVDAGLSHHGVNDLGCTVEVGSAGRVVTHSGALDALFVLFVALFAGVFVFFHQLDVAQGQTAQVVVHDHVAVRQVLVEILVFLRTLGVHGDDHAAVRQLFQLGVVHCWHVNHLGLFLAPRLGILVRVAADEAVVFWVYWELGCHMFFLVL